MGVQGDGAPDSIDESDGAVGVFEGEEFPHTFLRLPVRMCATDEPES